MGDSHENSPGFRLSVPSIKFLLTIISIHNQEEGLRELVKVITKGKIL